MLWFEQIVPTLLPFSIISYICIHSKLFHKYYFYFSFVSGFLFGMPLGAKLAAEGYQNQLLDKDDAQVIANYANNLSPSFLLIYVFSNSISSTLKPIQIFVLLYTIPILRLLLWKTHRLTSKTHKSTHLISIQEIDNGIISSFEALIKLCGYIVMFSILAQIFLEILPPNNKISSIIISLLEITNGINSWKTNFKGTYIDLLIIFMELSFGGFSCIMQSASILKNANLSIKNYIKTKVLLTLLCGLQAALLLFFWIK